MHLRASVGEPAFSPKRGDSVRDSCTTLVHRQHFDNAQAFTMLSHSSFRNRSCGRVPHEQIDAEVAKGFAQGDGSQPAMSTGGDAFTRSRDKTPRTFAKVKKRAKGAIQAPSGIK